MRVVVALLAAVLSGGGALYGVYTKARSESRQETTASYETLAPEINNLKRAMEELEQQNRALAGGGKVQVSGRDADDADAESPARTRRKTAARSPEAAPQPSETPAATPPAAPGAEQPPVAQPAPAPAPAPQQTPGVFDQLKDRVPIDFKKAEEIYRGIRKSNDPTPKP